MVEQSKENTFNFVVNGFNIFSLTTILLLAISIGLNLGLFFLTALFAISFVLFPRLYWLFQPFSRLLLKITSSNKTDFVDALPMVNFKGKWFMEMDSEHIQMKSIKDVLKFVWEKKTDFFLIAPGINLFLIQFMYYLGIFDLDPERGDLLDNVIESDYFIYSDIIPFIIMFYFSITWVWESAEIKLGKINSESAIHRKNYVSEDFEANELQFASNSLRNLILFFTGINVINWAAEANAQLNQETNFWLSFVIMVVVFVLMTSGYAVFLGVMYFRSSAHSKIVNKLRTDILKDYSESLENLSYKRKYNIEVRRSEIRKVIVNPSITQSSQAEYQLTNSLGQSNVISSIQPNFCKYCGFKIMSDQNFCKGCGTRIEV